MFKPACLPVLIGSLPLDDHDEAVRLILAHTPAIPLWPQLPQLPKEGMIRQFLDGYPGLEETGNRCVIAADRIGFAGEMAAFYEDYLQAEELAELPDTSRFGLTDETAGGFSALLAALAAGRHRPVTVKGQVTGPISVGIGVKDQTGTGIIYDDNLRDMLTKLLAFKARWQVERLRGCTTAYPPVIFVDEPALVSFGSTAFGGISREMVSQAVAEVLDAITAAGGLSGIHICANGDWAPALAVGADIISFDAYSYFDNFILFREPLIEFLLRGGVLAWGIVPTGAPRAIAEETVASLYERWRRQLEIVSSFGFSEERLIAQTLITPSCGTGSLSRDQALKVLSLTSRLARKIRERHQGPGD